jgi:hypothetical protein
MGDIVIEWANIPGTVTLRRLNLDNISTKVSKYFPAEKPPFISQVKNPAIMQ